MMIRIGFHDAIAACKTFEVLRELLDDVPLHITGEGIKVMALDPGHVAIISALWPKHAFAVYDGVSPTDDIVLGVKLTNLLKLLRFSQKGDTCEFLYDTTSDGLTVVIQSLLRQATFSLKLIDLVTDELHVPPMEIHACASMASTELAMLVKDLGTISDTVIISTGESAQDGILFEANGDIGRAKICLRSASVEQTVPVRLGFALRYLASFSKAAAIAEKVSLCLTQDMPLCVEYKTDACTLRYFLAPKLDDDDDDDDDDGDVDDS